MVDTLSNIVDNVNRLQLSTVRRVLEAQHRRIVMGRIQKATAAALALTITLVGSTLAIAPIARADSRQVVTRAHDWSATQLHRAAVTLRSAASSARPG
jgi:hypothetical protein